MSDDLGFEMEVVDTESAKDSSSDVGQQTSPTGKKKKQQTQTETPSAKLWPSIPEDWEMVAGNEVYDANPTRYGADGEVDYIEMDALKTDLPDPKYVGRRDPSDYSGQMFASGDTLFAQITPCTENGKAALVPELRSEVGIGSTEFIVLSPNRAKILPDYLYYLSKSHPVHNYAVSRMRGSTGRQRVPVDVFRKELQIPLPPLPEQRKIASVLHAVDRAIQKTEEIIERTQHVQRGLLQELLRTGYWNHETEHAGALGKTPKDWRKVKLHEVAKVQRGKFTHRPRNDPGFYDGDYPFIQTGEVVEATGELFDYSQTLNEKGKGVSKRFEAGTIILTIAGNIGDTAVATFPVYFPDSLVGITPSDEVDPYFLEFYLRERKPYLNRLATETTQKNLNLSLLRPVDVAIPPLEEQRKIAGVLKGLDSKIRTERGYVSCLHELKKGLMQDLLTGEVRTVDKAIEVLEEVQTHG
ncbi:restriction endonuclease subunit S [Salinibacter sp.]|jgi:type I restriction enzyme S subunit|uniref:restriction endonuclease subunit S n=1 Tax=Salinibacter sp. TaxID=2065818 RepID=UPI001ABACCD9|nr:restriction endonuclease subunit S [Salinibacter sp.]